ncbi:MAG: hypothetical protein QXX12_00045 [Nanopusillaceae archaeon]
MSSGAVKDVIVFGKAFRLRELTFGEVQEINDESFKVTIDEQGRPNVSISTGRLRLLLLVHCIEEPKMSEEEVRALPSRVARELLSYCIDLNPDFRGL